MLFYRILTASFLLLALVGITTTLVRADSQNGKVIALGLPLAGQPHVARPFQAPTHPYGPGHRGVDLVGEKGDAVLAAASGVIAFAGDVAGREVISIDHHSDIRTTYEPVKPQVKAGDYVTAGEIIGYLLDGHLGCGNKACLHWGARDGSAYLDPMSMVTTVGRVRLLPLQPGDASQ